MTLQRPLIINVVVQGSTAAEWKDCHASALLIGKRGAEMAEQMQRSTCLLVMEYVPGTALFTASKPFGSDKLEQTAADLGRLIPVAVAAAAVVKDVAIVAAALLVVADRGACSWHSTVHSQQAVWHGTDCCRSWQVGCCCCCCFC